jgi:hypothetical protein
MQDQIIWISKIDDSIAHDWMTPPKNSWSGIVVVLGRQTASGTSDARCKQLKIWWRKKNQRSSIYSVGMTQLQFSCNQWQKMSYRRIKKNQRSSIYSVGVSQPQFWCNQWKKWVTDVSNSIPSSNTRSLYSSVLHLFSFFWLWSKAEQENKVPFLLFQLSPSNTMKFIKAIAAVLLGSTSLAAGKDKIGSKRVAQILSFLRRERSPS